MSDNTSMEWAVALGDRGYLASWGPMLFSIVDKNAFQLAVHEQREDAVHAAKNLQRHLESLAAPELAKLVHIVSRQITVSRSDWRVQILPSSTTQHEEKGIS